VGLHPDGGGLYLQVITGNDGHLNKSWLFRFAIDGHERRMGLGPLHTIGLGEARDAATEARKLPLAGRDPIEVRNAGCTATAISNAKLMSFTECAVAGDGKIIARSNGEGRRILIDVASADKYFTSLPPAKIKRDKHRSKLPAAQADGVA
jgi:Arm DNA-binding domain